MKTNLEIQKLSKHKFFAGMCYYYFRNDNDKIIFASRIWAYTSKTAAGTKWYSFVFAEASATKTLDLKLRNDPKFTQKYSCSCWNTLSEGSCRFVRSLRKHIHTGTHTRAGHTQQGRQRCEELPQRRDAPTRRGTFPKSAARVRASHQTDASGRAAFRRWCYASRRFSGIYRTSVTLP